MATISGTWLFNEVISRPSVDIYTFNDWEKGQFVSSAFNQTRLHYDGTDLEYRSASDDVVVYNFDTNKWANSDYRSIDFGTTPQEVDEAFYTWFTANATKQTEEEQPTTPTKKFTRLHRLDIVASSGGKCFRELYKNNGVVGWWILNDTLTPYTGEEIVFESTYAKTFICNDLTNDGYFGFCKYAYLGNPAGALILSSVKPYNKVLDGATSEWNVFNSNSITHTFNNIVNVNYVSTVTPSDDLWESAKRIWILPWALKIPNIEILHEWLNANATKL